MLDTSDTSSELAVCGDGIIEGDEQCDDGNPDNTDACTSLCTLAVCGDMFIHDGVEECDDANMDNADECTNYCTVAVCGDMTVEGPEECDDGDADNEDYCTAACRIAACGDGFVQPGETCDDGNQDMNDFCAGCQINGKFVFVTSEKYSGDLNGIGGADAICNAHAKVADLPGHYMAWISTNYVEENPDQRFSKSTKPYYLVNLVQVADDWVDLTDGTLDAPIDRTELNTDSPVTDMDCMGNFRTVRTGTASDGSLQGTQCGNFTYASVGMTSTIGSTLSWNSDWTACELSADQVCSIPMPIYCFEQ